VFDLRVPPGLEAVYSLGNDGRVFLLIGIVVDVLSGVGGQMQPKMAEIDHKQVINCLIESFQETSEPGFSRE
jgi:hypothetical protein